MSVDPDTPWPRVSQGEMVYTLEQVAHFREKWNETLRRGQNHQLTCQTEAVQARCVYCQTLILATAAVRCSSCGAPR